MTKHLTPPTEWLYIRLRENSIEGLEGLYDETELVLDGDTLDQYVNAGECIALEKMLGMTIGEFLLQEYNIVVTVRDDEEEDEEVVAVKGFFPETRQAFDEMYDATAIRPS